MVFWHTGFDDYDGVMFLEGEFTDDIWNGLRRIEKLHGDSYVVYTYL